MKKQVLFLLAIMVNCSVVFAQLTWTNGNANGAYGEDDNWNEGFPPGEFDQVLFDGNTNAQNCIVTGEQEGGWFEIGVGGTPYGTLIIQDGAHLQGKFAHWSAVGWTTEATLLVEAGGTFSVAEHLWLGFNPGSNSHVHIAGTIIVTGMYGQNFIGNADTKSDLTIYNGGVLNLSQFHAEGNSIQGSDQLLTIMGGGTMIITGDHTSILATHIAAEQIVAPGGSVNVVYDVDSDKTTLTSSADPILGLSDIASLDFRMYPNPTADFITIKAKTAISNVKIYSTLGRLVKDVTAENRIDVSDLSAGYYIVKIKDELGHLGVKKLIKN